MSALSPLVLGVVGETHRGGGIILGTDDGQPTAQTIRVLAIVADQVVQGIAHAAGGNVESTCTRMGMYVGACMCVQGNVIAYACAM